MKQKQLVRRILYPHPLILWLLGPSSILLLIYTSVRYESTDVISIISYALSFCALLLVSLRIPDIIRFVKRFRQENRYVIRYTTDARLKLNLSLYGSLAFNAVYAVFQLGLGLLHRSVWFFSMSGYYLLLAIMRFLLLRHTRNHAPGACQEAEWRKHRLCGVFLLIITLALAVFIIYFVWKIRVFRHHEITTIAMAAYTFTSLTMAIINAVRSRNLSSPVYSAVRLIALVCAIVSMLTLENAMLTAFGQENTELFHRFMLGASGIAAIAAVQSIAIHMIVNAGRHLQPLRTSQTTF